MFSLTGNSILGPNSLTGSRIFDGFNVQAATFDEKRQPVGSEIIAFGQKLSLKR